MDGTSLILIVDRNHRNVELLSQFIQEIGYQTISATDLEAFDRIVADAPNIALVLIDLAGFTKDVWERCERLRESGISFLVISPKQSAAIQRESLAYGARGVLIKPLVMRDLVAVIRSLVSDTGKG